MYIALKWLLGMVMTMWVGLCSIDFYLKDVSARHMLLSEINELNNVMSPIMKNFTYNEKNILIHQNSFEKTEKKIYPAHSNSIFSQFVTFISGACLVAIYYRKHDFILYSTIKLKSINTFDVKKHLRKIKTLKYAAKIQTIRVAISKILEQSMGIFKKIRIYLLYIYKENATSKRNPLNVNLLLLNKLREYGQERRNLGHVLFAAIRENKNMRMRYQLETLAKKRLARNVELTQKQLKENRSRYVSYQQLYVLTHQENNFLKSRIRKLTQDKEDAEKNLIKLVNHVWQSKNNELKAYCTRFIVRTKDNLLNSDVKAEIDQFLTQSSKSKQRYSDQETNLSDDLDTINEMNEVYHEKDLTALVKDAPKLRGLPGECVWTVKDKGGFIEKLYEYETDFDNGDTIRKIRQYSVYYDKDCLLDVSSSTTLIPSTNIDLTGICHQYMNKRITGSQAFQKFLKTNKIIVLPRKLHCISPPPLIY